MVEKKESEGSNMKHYFSITVGSENIFSALYHNNMGVFFHGRGVGGNLVLFLLSRVSFHQELFVSWLYCTTPGHKAGSIQPKSSRTPPCDNDSHHLYDAFWTASAVVLWDLWIILVV